MRARLLARNVCRIWRYWIEPIFPLQKTILAIGYHYPLYILALSRYRKLATLESVHLRDTYPCLFDTTSITSYDAHYFFQAVWAMKRIAEGSAKWHVDVGSDVRFVAMLTTHLPVTFVDIRPLQAPGVTQLSSVAGNLTALPFADGSVESLSCLHVAEHVGLGRYGDPLDPSGTHRACSELARVLAPNGSLFFSLPVGQVRVCFNAHRIHSPQQIVCYFQGLELVEFSAVDDRGCFLTDIEPGQMENAEYGCGLFHFRRNSA